MQEVGLGEHAYLTIKSLIFEPGKSCPRIIGLVSFGAAESFDEKLISYDQEIKPNVGFSYSGIVISSRQISVFYTI